MSIKNNNSKAYPLDEKIIEYLTGIFATREDISKTVRTELHQVKETLLQEVLSTLSRELWATSLDEIEKFVCIADELSLMRLLIVPLFRSMGYERVRAEKHHHRTLEFGQDIREMKLRLPSGHFLYFVAQVKKETLRSSTKYPSADIEAVLVQLEKALEKKLFDYDIDSEVRADHGYLIVSGNISKDARIFLEERISTEKRRKILVIDGDDILRLCKEYGLPLESQVGIRSFLKQFTKRSPRSPGG